MTLRPRLLPEGWYPSDPAAAERFVARALAAPVRRAPSAPHRTAPSDTAPSDTAPSDTAPSETAPAQAAIVPHAGWTFSGDIAARTLAALARSRPAPPDLVVLFGGHMPRRGRPLFVLDAEWETPFGPQRLDSARAERWRTRWSGDADDAWAADNSMEVVVPLIRHLFPGARLLALRLVSEPGAAELAARAARELADEHVDAVAVGSTDLTHYGAQYGFRPRGGGEAALRWARDENDRGFLARCEALDGAGAIEHAHTHHSACSAAGAAGAIGFASALGARRGVVVEHGTSHEISPADSFVGYAGVLLE